MRAILMATLSLLLFFYDGFSQSTSPSTTSELVSESSIYEELEVENFSLYPNPATDFVTVDLGANIRDARIKIYDQMGKMVASGKFSGSTYSANIADLKSGVYSVAIDSGKNKTMKRFVKQ